MIILRSGSHAYAHSCSSLNNYHHSSDENKSEINLVSLPNSLSSIRLSLCDKKLIQNVNARKAEEK